MDEYSNLFCIGYKQVQSKIDEMQYDTSLELKTIPAPKKSNIHKDCDAFEGGHSDIEGDSGNAI